ncbi:MAG: efflux RND transporter periplasmic adaptor subunit [Gammaproteobacteria bacterium]|nr:efflux RND transporter periplasmic adaptor subunit [Gammaproteobacteria bacterium]
MTQTPGSVNRSTVAITPSAQTGPERNPILDDRSQEWCRWQFSVLPEVQSLVLFYPVTEASSPQSQRKIAAWPPQTQADSLEPLVAKAWQQKKCLSGRLQARDGGVESCCLAIPLPASAPEKVAMVVTSATATSTHQAIRQLVEWGSYWLLRTTTVPNEQSVSAAVQSLAQTVALHESVQASCEELVARIADYLNCECVSIGFSMRQAVTCRAVSDAPKFDSRMALVNAIENAMDESIEQQCSVGTSINQSTITRSHDHLRSASGGLSCFSVPIYLKDQILGAITVLGPEEGSETDGVAWLEKVADAVAPVLNLQLLEERTVIQRLRLQTLERWRDFTGREHTGRQLTAMAVTLFFLGSLVVPGTHRVAARASLEGSDKQVITAPTTGFVLEAGARAGDTVQQGDVIARLDDRELLVKQRQWQAEIDKLEKSYSQALAESDRTQLSLLRAQRAEYRAELDLVQQQLERIVIKAPFSGVLVAGDLSQQLGAPVEAGETLFEITSLDSWRLLVDVDEHAVADIKTGQSGFLRLASMPDHGYAMTVREIMPVALSRDGETVFRLEAMIDEHDERLRPGMQGVAKIDVGQSPYLWIWTHRFFKRLRIWFWSLGL